jgi:phosphoserine phosphatase
MLQRAYDLICFDVDGTLVHHPTGKVIWEVLNQRFTGDHTINIERHRWYNEGRITYEHWVELDVQGWITAGATRGECRGGANSSTRRPARRCSSSNSGVRLAIISAHWTW